MATLRATTAMMPKIATGSMPSSADPRAVVGEPVPVLAPLEGAATVALEGTTVGVRVTADGVLRAVVLGVLEAMPQNGPVDVPAEIMVSAAGCHPKV